VFGLIIEYSSLMDFWPLGNNRSLFIGGFLKDYILACAETWDILKDFGFFFEDFLKMIFLHGEIFEFSSFFFCLKILFNVNGKATVWHAPCWGCCKFPKTCSTYCIWPFCFLEMQVKLIFIKTLQNFIL
jgi:hypothetical protein